MTDELKAKKVWEYADGKSIRAQVDTAVKDSSRSTREWKKVVEEYEENGEAAAALIHQHVSISIDGQLHHHVAYCTSASDIWRSNICTAQEKLECEPHIVEMDPDCEPRTVLRLIR